MMNVACGLARDAHGRVLLEERTKGEYQGFWDLPGGKLEPGEGYAEALVREWREELGVEIEVTKILGIRDGLAPAGYKLGFYEVRILSGEPTPKDGQRIAWITEEELGAYVMLPQDYQILREFVWPE